MLNLASARSFARSFAGFATARFVSGLGLGVAKVSSAWYAAETAPADYRQAMYFAAQGAYSSGAALGFAAAAVLGPGAAAQAVFGLAALPDTPPDARTLQVVFIGLAALTVPHMMLIEPLRLRGWRA